MPLYEYKCEYCEETFSDFLPIDRRKEPEENDCPSCGTPESVKQVISAPAITAGDGRFNSRIPDGFKDRLREIKKISGKHNKIDV